MAGRPAAGGGRWVEVDPARLRRWVDGFAQRHGDPVATPQTYGIGLSGADGAVAELHLPAGAGPVDTVDSLVSAVTGDRLVGLLLVRRGGYAVGVAGAAGLVASKVDTAYVQSRTAAGGWSQQRFARRRDNQARALAGAAADTAVRLLAGRVRELAALVCGGDRGLVDQVLSDPRLAALRELRGGALLDVPDPRLEVLRQAAQRARAVRIRVVDPD